MGVGVSVAVGVRVGVGEGVGEFVGVGVRVGGGKVLVALGDGFWVALGAAGAQDIRTDASRHR